MAERIEGTRSFFANWRRPDWGPGEVIDPDREMASESLRELGREVAQATRTIMAQREATATGASQAASVTEQAYAGVFPRATHGVEMVPFQAPSVMKPVQTEVRQ